MHCAAALVERKVYPKSKKHKMARNIVYREKFTRNPKNHGSFVSSAISDFGSSKTKTGQGKARQGQHVCRRVRV